MSAIGRGSWVQCVSDAAEPMVRRNGCYCVEAIVRVDGINSCMLHNSIDCGGLRLYGVDSPEGFGICALLFKPLGGNSKTAPPQEVITEWERALEDA